MSERRIAAVTLDAAGTLIYSDPPAAAIYARHLSRYGPPVRPEEVEPVFMGAWAELQQRLPPGTDRYGVDERQWWGAFVREVLSRLDHPAPWQPLLDDLYAAFARTDVWHLFPETRDTLGRLKERDLRLGLISNWDRRLPEILAGLGIDLLFDVITVSGLAGVEKPAGAIFRLTLERLGVDAGAAIHVGDSPRDDYHGASGAGMVPVLIDRRGLFGGDSFRRIESLAEIHTLLDQV